MRKHQGTRMFAGALSCVLALSLLPGTALAAEEAATVYQGDGYYITAELYGNQNLDLDSTSLFSDGLVNFGRDGLLTKTEMWSSPMTTWRERATS